MTVNCFLDDFKIFYSSLFCFILVEKGILSYHIDSTLEVDNRMKGSNCDDNITDALRIQDLN